MSKTIKVKMPTEDGSFVDKEYTIDDLVENVADSNRVYPASARGVNMYTVIGTFNEVPKDTIYIAPPCNNGALYDTGISVKELEPLKEERAAEIAAAEEAARKEEEERKAAEEEAARLTQEEYEKEMAKLEKENNAIKDSEANLTDSADAINSSEEISSNVVETETTENNNEKSTTNEE